MQTVLLAAQFVFLLGIMVFSAGRTIRTQGSFRAMIQGSLLLYALAIAWSLFFSVLIPTLLVVFGADRDAVISSFPEATCNTPIIMLGWFPSSVFVILVRVLYDILKIIHGEKWTKW